jgi:hypothetical protein
MRSKHHELSLREGSNLLHPFILYTNAYNLCGLGTPYKDYTSMDVPDQILLEILIQFLA